jgi:predicted O-methyltransferase YrrM
MKRLVRFGLLGLYYLHPTAVVVGLRRGPRALSRYLKEIYRASKLTAGAYLPALAVEELVEGPVEVRIFRPDDWNCSMTLAEISTLCCLVATRKPTKVLEIGTYRGLTTLNLALNAPLAEVHTVDITDSWGSYYYSERLDVTNIHQHYGDTTSFDFMRDVGTGIDFCLIDGGHDYQQVRDDTIRVLPLMSDDGILLWDDYGRNDFLADFESFKVSQFIHEIKDCGVCVLYGTGLVLLQLSPEIRQRLIAQLTPDIAPLPELQYEAI